MALKRYSAWLVEEDLADADPLRDLKPPKLDTKVVEGLTDQQCADLVKACQGKEFIDRRDEAVARLLIETGMRAGEVLATPRIYRQRRSGWQPGHLTVAACRIPPGLILRRFVTP